MAESKVNRENFILLQGFMLADLKLKGNELIIYACIYGFSQAEKQTFNGSLQYLADWTNSTKQSVIKCLKSLIEKGYIEKTETFINGVKFCEYRIIELNTVLNKVEHPIKQSLTGGSEQSLPNNICLDNKEDKKEEKKESKQTTFDDILRAYTTDEKTLELLGEWLKVRKAKRAAMTDTAIQLNINKLDSLAKKSGLTVPAYLEEIICRGWAAFYEIKNFNDKNSGQKIGDNGIAISSEKSDLDKVF